MYNDESGYDSNNRSNGEDNTKGFWIFLPLGIAIALYENGSRWKKAVFDYFANFIQHPVSLFHIDPLLFILLLFILTRGIVGVIKRRFI